MADFVEVNKIMTGIDWVNTQSLPRVAESRAKGNRLKIREEQFNRNPRDNFFYATCGGCLERDPGGGS